MAVAKSIRARRARAAPVESRHPRPPVESRAELRARLFEAAAVVDVIRHASCSNLGELDGDQLAVALAVVYGLIDRVASALERPGRAA